MKQCFHCGNLCDGHLINYEEKNFCCNGCKTVYEIFSENNLTCYYDFEDSPGTIPKEFNRKFDFLDNTSIIETLVEFNDGVTQITTLYIPNIHCSSCIWVLENLHKLHKNITSSQVDFPKKTVRIVYRSKEVSLKRITVLLSSIGYEPYISLDDYKRARKEVNRDLIYKLAIAGFAFGNVMFLSFPEYFEVSGFWLEKYKFFFRWLIFFFSLPVVFYAAQDYFISAYKGLKAKNLNIDVPIALGISVLFIRSSIEIIFDLGTGFFDSLTGLVFFLLLGKFFQQKTYNSLSFERDYKSYFPIAITKISDGKEIATQIYEIKKGDRLLIRNQELIPTDGILINGNAQIDYSFVTGESKMIAKKSGDKLFAGGKQVSGAIEIEALTSVEQSYLTQLWSNDLFKKSNQSSFKTLTNSISKHFTITVISIALLSLIFWLFFNPNKALSVFTAVLIIACPCAVALAAPFTFGNFLRILGKLKFYIKNIDVLEQLANVNTIVFDKTGTLTSNKNSTIEYEGNSLSEPEEILLKNSLRSSNHPLSRSLYNLLKENDIITLDSYKEHIGKGIEASYQNEKIKIGSAKLVGNTIIKKELHTSVHISTNDIYKGKYTFYNKYRKGVSKLFNKLKTAYNLVILSGDNNSEKENLEKLLPTNTKMIFNQKPNDKLEYIKYHQSEGEKVLMVGDGLNDAGALAQSNIGIAIAENVNVFSPACDAILDASKLQELDTYIKISKAGVKIVKWSFVLSFIYNTIGLYFAITGQLEPVVAAILMPLSSISIVVFTTVTTNLLGRKIK